jgi:hypothetical protein
MAPSAFLSGEDSSSRGVPGCRRQSRIGVDTSSTDFSGWHMECRVAAARLALPEKEHKSMIKFQSAAITCGPDP